MECWCVSKHKSWLLMISMMMIHSLMVWQTQGVCIEEERKALLEIKASLIDSYDMDPPLPTWVDDGSSSGGVCCEWERVTCNTTTGHVTNLSLSNIMGMAVADDTGLLVGISCERMWLLNVSLFLHFKELASLALSFDCLDNSVVSTGLKSLLSLKKLEILDLSHNSFENGIFPSLGALTSLRVLHLGYNDLEGYFPALALENLEILDLTGRGYYGSLKMQGFQRVSMLKKLEVLNLGNNEFNESLITSLSDLPSLKSLDLRNNLFGSFPAQELSHLRDLEVLLLSNNSFNGTLPMEALTSFHHLEVLDLSCNNFSGSIPSTIQSLSSLRVLSFAKNRLNGLLLDHGLCELKNLHELDLSNNMFDGNLPQCFNGLSSLKLLDISSNLFTGILSPSLIVNLTYLEYADFSYNRFGGSFSFNLFSNHTKLKVVKFESESDGFEVETQEPIGWIPMFQLEVLVLSSCNISVFPGFLLHQHKLRILDLSHNSLGGPVPNWLIKNNTMLDILILRNNSFGSIISTSANTRLLDMSQNLMNGTIPGDIQKLLPCITHLNLSGNFLDGVIPSSIGDLNNLRVLDLSDNELSGEVPKGLFTNISGLSILQLSKNRLRGEVLSENLSLGSIYVLLLDSNRFTGKIGSNKDNHLGILDISNNFFTGTIPHWISNSNLSLLLVSNNNLEGQFPCGTTPLLYLDISRNSFSGPIPTCLNFQYIKHLHLGSNKFTGSIPSSLRNLTGILTLDVGNNSLSGRIPNFLGELSNLRILIMRKNNFIGSIPKKLCQLSNVNLVDLSSNSLSGSVRRCLQNIIGSMYPSMETEHWSFFTFSGRHEVSSTYYDSSMVEAQDKYHFTIENFLLWYGVQFRTRSISMGGLMMVGLDLSDNKLTGEIPQPGGLGYLSSMLEIRLLNLSHNQLTGTIPVHLSDLEMIESLDLSSNGLSGKVPSELIKLTSLALFNVSYNNLSGRLPDIEAQFSTFTSESYEGNPLLCGPPLEKKCAATWQVTDPSTKEGNDKRYDIDMASFYGSCGATWVVFLLGFVAVLYINPYWRRRWLDFVEECMYTSYYFLEDSVRKLSMVFRKKDLLH